MKQFKNISLIYECDAATLERAAVLANENRARLTLVYPAREVAPQWQTLTVGEKEIDVSKLVRQEQQRRLKEAARSLKPFGVKASTRWLSGEPFLEIIRDVIENQRDLVIMTAEGTGGLKARLFGTTSQWLMRKCPAPVLVLKPTRSKRFKRILAAIDPESTGDSRDTLNRLILELATSLATRDDGELHVVHAWSLLGETKLRGLIGIPDEDMERAMRLESTRRLQVIQQLLSQQSLVDYQLHLRKGDPAEVIPALVAKFGIDMLVMGTVCRTGIPGFIIGNTAERVLAGVECSVLTVKPEGFVSPLESVFKRT